MTVKDKITGKVEVVLDTTTNSYLVTLSKLTGAGINCSQWFTEKEFNNRFEIVKNKSI
jgi:hypothetical protein